MEVRDSEIEELGAETVAAVTKSGPPPDHIYCAKQADYWKGYVIFTAVIWRYERCHLQIAFWQQAVSLSHFTIFICFELLPAIDCCLPTMCQGRPAVYPIP